MTLKLFNKKFKSKLKMLRAKKLLICSQCGVQNRISVHPDDLKPICERCGAELHSGNKKGMIKKFLIKTIDAIDPKCHCCGQRFFPFSNCRKELSSLKLLGAYKTKYEKMKKLCERCWGDIRTVKCSLCGSSLDIFKNRKERLLYNLSDHHVTDHSVQNAKRICSKCCKNLAYVQCSRCRKPFKSIENKKNDYTKISDYLRTYHPNYSDELDDLCQTCYQEYLSSCKKVQLILKNWVGGTKREFIRGYKTLKSLDKVEHSGTSCRNPLEVEEYLKLYSAQLGGNGFTDFFWQKHEQKHAEKVLAGYSNNKNPYYQTKYWTERWFTGYATAVIVEEFKKKPHKYHRFVDSDKLSKRRKSARPQYP